MADTNGLHHDGYFESEEKFAHVLVLYTGGTIGMKNTPDGFCPAPNFFCQQMKLLPMLYDAEYHEQHKQNIAEQKIEKFDSEYEELVMPLSEFGVRTFYYLNEYIPLKDSSNMNVDDWVQIAMDIKANYEKYNAFVILHGTDTMSYSASALSFMLEGLGKTVVFTGSQIPIYEQRNDGRDNILGALMIAAHFIIPEVTLYFQQKLYRGNRTTKVNSGSFQAFDSPNLPPLVDMKIDINVQWDAVLRNNSSSKFCVHTNMNTNVGVLRLFPGITAATVQAFLQPPMQGVVLQSYGAGNGPDNRPDLMAEFQSATDRGVIIVNITQCIQGPVVEMYASGKRLVRAGIISGADMTPEAALTKLSYLLGKTDLTVTEKRQAMCRNLKGELTVAASQHQFSFKDSEFLRAVASVLHVGSSKEMMYIRNALFPVLLCSAANDGSISAMEDLLSHGAVLDGGDHDSRTPLHLACSKGSVDTVKFLLKHGASLHIHDQFGHTPLHDAARLKHKEIIRILRKAGAHLGPTTTEIVATLCNAARWDDVGEIESWYLAGADLNCSDYDGRSPLHVACSWASKKVVEFLVNHGGDIHKKDRFEESSLGIAAIANNKDILEILKNADKVSRQKTGSKPEVKLVCQSDQYPG